MFKYILSLLVFLIMFSCAQDLGTVDRTKSGKIEKSLFNSSDVWYMRNTIIDVPFNTGFSFIGSQSDTELIRWRITEDYLYAHRAHDWIDGTEEEYIQSGETYFGAPVAIYNIKSHFDVQRQYNPSTGEESNVIIENTNDRPWNERKYIRVDWSKNLVDDLRFGSISSIPTSPLSYYVPETDENKKESFKISKNYIDIVGMIFAEPESVSFDGVKYPYCYLYSGLHQDCMGQRMKFRTSFFKKDKDNKYLPVQYDDVEQKKFGFFRTDRYKYDRWRGFARNNELHLINKWNLCTKEGSDITTCTLRQIPYYINDNFPEDLKEEAKKIVLVWNRIFKSTVAIARGENVEYNKEVLVNIEDYFDNEEIDGDSLKLDKDNSFLTDKDDIFVFCPNNPVKEGDPEICGKAGLNPQIGDLRYSMMYWVANPQASSPLGYGPSAADTETGEVFQANAFIYGNGVETYVTYIMDIISLLNNEVDIYDYIDGTYFKDYITKKQESIADINSNSVDVSDMKKNYDKISNFLNSGDFTQIASASERLNRIKGTKVEELLTDENLKKYFDSKNGNNSLIDMISPEKYQKMEEFRNKLSKKTIMMSSFKDQTMIAWAKKLKATYCKENKCSDEEKKKISTDVKKHVFFSVALHEMGHNMGLRHNYHSSSDAMNFFNGYWDLKAQQSNKFKPEFLEAPSQDILDKGLRENQYTSIMDYLASPNSSLKGAGVYDYAAIHYGYGKQVMVFDGNSYDKDFYNKVKSGDYHYSSYPYMLKEGSCSGEDTSDCTQSTSEALKMLRARKWHQLKNKDKKACGLNSDNIIATCEDSMKCNKFGFCVECLENSDCTSGFCSDTGECLDNVEVPIAFCSDELVGTDWRCYRFSEGADFYEKIKYQADTYNNYYFFRNFKRGKALYGVNFYSYLSRIAMTFLNIDNMIKYSAYESYIKRNDSNFIEKPGLGQHFAIGQKVAMNMFSSIMQTVNPGLCSPHDDLKDTYNCSPAINFKNDNRVNNPMGLGGDLFILRPSSLAKYETTYYDQDLGYNYFFKPIIQGVYLDKLLSVIYMSDPFFVPKGESFSGKLKKYAVNLNILFPNEYQKVLASVYSEQINDYSAYLPTKNGNIIKNTNGSAKVKLRPSVFYSDAQKVEFENELTTAKYLMPSTMYTARLYAGYAIPAFLHVTWLTSSLYDSARISLKGSGDDYEPDWATLTKYDGNNEDDADYIEITDPKTRKTYYAMKYNSHGQIGESDYNLGWTLIKRALDRYDDTSTQSYIFDRDIESIDIMRSFYHYYR